MIRNRPLLRRFLDALPAWVLLTTALVAIAGADTMPKHVVTAPSQAEPHETEAETIAKGLADMASADANARARAVLILGKYATPRAQAAVVQALQDPVSDIRRSALVALTERPLSVAVRAQVLRMIGDEDVHVRRLASSYLREAMFARGPVITGPGGVTRVLRGRRPRLSTETATVLRKAFSDPDPTVRKNMLSAVFQIREIVTPGMVISRLHDEDREIRVLALNALRTMQPIGRVLENTAFLADDPDPSIRRRLAAMLGHADVAGVNALLRKLCQDSDFDVATEAVFSLAKNRDKEAFPELVRRLDDSRLRRETAVGIIRYLSMWEDGGEAALLKLTGHPNATYRYAALQTYGNCYRHSASPDIFVRLLDDDTARVRSLAATILMRTPALNTKITQQLLANRHPDVRAVLVRESSRRPAEAATELLQELFLDDDTDVRLQAVAEFCRRQLKGWPEVLIASLDGEEPETQLLLGRRVLRGGNRTVARVVGAVAQQVGNEDLKRLAAVHRGIRAGRQPSVGH